HELPLFYTYLVSEPKNQNGEKNHKSKKSHWNKIDAAFPHKEGKGHDVVLDGGGKIVLRMRKKKRTINRSVAPHLRRNDRSTTHPPSTTSKNPCSTRHPVCSHHAPKSVRYVREICKLRSPCHPLRSYFYSPRLTAVSELGRWSENRNIISPPKVWN